MGTLIIVSVCIVIAAAIVAFGLWAKDNPSATLDAPGETGISQRDWMNMR